MNSRRKFLIQGGMATTALLAAKPFKAIAGASSPITGFGTNNRVIFLHTSDLHDATPHQLISHIAELKSSTGNVVLLNASNNVAGNVAALNYDASISQSNAVSATANNYRIIYKGNIKIGVITATAGDTGLFSNVNTLASYLKKEKYCHLVVCLSQLGYKNKNTMDDLNLAAASSNLDIIIGGDAKNFQSHPVIALNSKKEEVIIHSASGDPFACGIIKIDFDGQGRKKHIGFTDQSLKNTAPGRAMPAA